MSVRPDRGRRLLNPSGGSYQNINITGSSTAHLGDNYFLSPELPEQSIETWMGLPGTSNSYETALNKHKSGTGTWFTESEQFKNWQKDPMSLVWLHGPAGCGKTVLAARVIESLTELRDTHSDVVVAYHFFSFRERSTLHASSMLRALLVEMIRQANVSKVEAERLRSKLNGKVPSLQDLIECLQSAINDRKTFYFVIDAMDECGDLDANRDEVIDTISTILQWLTTHIHTLIISRNHLDISTTMKALNATVISMEAEKVKSDIAMFIRGRMATDHMLRRWNPYSAQIEDKLVAGSGGIFRWAECQLRSLRQCPTSARHLQRCLECLPKDLYSTYEQMLCSINENFKEDAKRLLSMLCFAERQMTSAEVLEALAVDLNPPAKFDSSLKMLEPDDLRRLCPDLVEVGAFGSDEQVVRISHSSIRDYLMSDHIKNGRAAYFWLTNEVGVAQLSQICLVYLNHVTTRQFVENDAYLSSKTKYSMYSKISNVLSDNHDFLGYSATHWHDHYTQTMPSRRTPMNGILFKLFSGVAKTFQILRQSCLESLRHHPCVLSNTHATNVYFENKEEMADSPVYYAASLGLNEVITMLNPTQAQINLYGGAYGTILLAAIMREHPETAELLLRLGAESESPQWKGRPFRHPLIEAAKRGYCQVVELLCDKGSSVDAIDEDGNNALCSAVQGGYLEVVSCLLKHGAYVDAVNGAGDTALKLACFGHRNIVWLLLRNNATPPSHHDVTTMLASTDLSKEQQGFAKILADLGFYDENALIHAASGGNLELVENLLAQGFNINKADVDGETALSRAVRAKAPDVVHKLLENLAEIDLTEDLRHNILGTAILFSNTDILSLLLKAGANPNCAVIFDVAVYSWLGLGRFNDIAQILLGQDFVNGADIINPLHLAIAMQEMSMVETLLQHGADINAQLARGSPLHLAIYADNEGILQVLLNHRPDASIRGQFGTPLETAQAFGLANIEFMILRHMTENVVL